MLAQAVLQCWLGGVRAAGRIGGRRTAISLIGQRNTLLSFIAQEADGMRNEKYYTSFPYPGCTPRVRSLLTAVAILHARRRPPSERYRPRRTRRRRSRGPLQPPPRQHKDGG